MGTSPCLGYTMADHQWREPPLEVTMEITEVADLVKACENLVYGDWATPILWFRGHSMGTSWGPIQLCVGLPHGRTRPAVAHENRGRS